MQATTTSRARFLTVTAAALAVPAVAAAAPPLTPVMTGLNNPYGLAFGPDGSLYVAEAGTGNGLAGSGPGFVDGNNAHVYFGDTGSVSRLSTAGVQTRVVTGLPSLGPAGGGETTGLSGLTFDAAGDLYGAFGFGGNESQRTQLVADVLANTGRTTTDAAYLGQVVRLSPTGNTVAPLSDLVPYETQSYAANNPTGGTVEANPYALAALPGGGLAASDGGGNVVLRVPAAGGSPSLLAALPAARNTTGIGGPYYESVPTALAVSPAGGLYVGEFTGYPFPAGGASVLNLNTSTGAATPYATGYTTISGMAFGPDGSLYVLDLTTNGLGPNPGDSQLLRYDPRTGLTTTVADLGPGAAYTEMVAGPDNALYLSVIGPTPGAGEVVRYALTAVPEPAGVAVAVAGLGLAGLFGRRRTC